MSSVRRHTGLVLALFTASGLAALVYQVLWVRELGLLFGSTARSAAVAIAIFFSGIAAGGWFWGRRAGRGGRPLRTFGLLEIGVAATALGHFLVVPTYHRVYPTLFELAGHHGLADLVVKVAIATTLLFPPAFLMGGTLPMMGQHLVARRGRLSVTGTTVYAVNTAGSAAGALAAGFVLPPLVGFRGAYLSAVVIDLAVGVIALVAGSATVARRTGTITGAITGPGSDDVSGRPADAAPGGPRHRPVPGWAVWTVAAVSGTVALAVEVVWTRLFAQVLQNSAYTYAIVLATFLVALSLGAAVAGVLARWRRADPASTLVAVLVVAGTATAASPWVFHLLTDGVTYLGADRAFTGYVVGVGVVAIVAMGLPAVALGTVLPFLLRSLEHTSRPPGEILGRLVAVNTVGAVAGALFGGFVVLPLLGPWRGLTVLAAVYPATAALVMFASAAATTRSRTRTRRGVTATAVAVLAATVLALPAGALADAALLRPGEHLVESRHGPQANVAVVGDADGELAIRVNTTYTLGGTRGLSAERDQALIPLLVHPEPRSVFFLGMGTGLTAGAALALPVVEHVVVCELITDVVELARAHFAPWTNGLFDDPRVTVVAEDGRTCLARSPDRYDVIISDLFVPWEAGTGNLYTREHYRTARERLHEGGVYVQWVPLYQVSDRELGIIANTMDDVFDEVVAWRGDFFPSRSVLALVGHRDPAPLDPSLVAERARSIATAPVRSDGQLEAMVLRHYVGNVTRSAVYADRPSNTDTRPRIEYLTPRTHRDVRAGRATFVVGDERERLYDELAAATPPTDDPYLARLDDAGLAAVTTGRIWSRYRATAPHDAARAAELLDEFRSAAPPRSTDDLSPARVLLPRILDGRDAAGSDVGDRAG